MLKIIIFFILHKYYPNCNNNLFFKSLFCKDKYFNKNYPQNDCIIKSKEN